ncbi:hypothetical protein TNCV_2844941 [Trichonephila clavipes]|nr:hypothetical protein TNCV_2844941 [Trichonephila clavipes]
MPNSVYVTLGPEMHDQVFWSVSHSDAKPPVLSVLYRPTQGMKGADSTLPSPGFEPHLWCESQAPHSDALLLDYQNSRLNNAFRFVEWAQNEFGVVPDFHKRILFSDEAHFWFNGYVNKQNCRICSEANKQVYVETPLHPEKLTVWCALWAGGILLQKR